MVKGETKSRNLGEVGVPPAGTVIGQLRALQVDGVAEVGDGEERHGSFLHLL